MVGRGRLVEYAEQIDAAQNDERVQSILAASSRLVVFARHYQAQNVLPTALFSMAYINGREERLTFGDLYRLADAVEQIQKL